MQDKLWKFLRIKMVATYLLLSDPVIFMGLSPPVTAAQFNSNWVATKPWKLTVSWETEKMISQKLVTHCYTAGRSMMWLLNFGESWLYFSPHSFLMMELSWPRIRNLVQPYHCMLYSFSLWIFSFIVTL